MTNIVKSKLSVLELMMIKKSILHVPFVFLDRSNHGREWLGYIIATHETWALVSLQGLFTVQPF